MLDHVVAARGSERARVLVVLAQRGERPVMQGGEVDPGAGEHLATPINVGCCCSCVSRNASGEAARNGSVSSWKLTSAPSSHAERANVIGFPPAEPRRMAGPGPR